MYRHWEAPSTALRITWAPFEPQQTAQSSESATCKLEGATERTPLWVVRAEERTIGELGEVKRGRHPGPGRRRQGNQLQEIPGCRSDGWGKTARETETEDRTGPATQTQNQTQTRGLDCENHEHRRLGGLLLEENRRQESGRAQ
jgi:hypothetical protein